MPCEPAKLFFVSRKNDPQLQRLNEKISRWLLSKPADDAFSAFALGGPFLRPGHRSRARVGQMPGIDMKALQPTIKFWESVRDHSGAAALACVGANRTLAGGLVAFRLVRRIGGEESEDAK